VDLCVVFGPVIGVAVGILKRIPFVKKNPKVVAAVLSVVVAVLGSPVSGDWKQYVQQLTLCIIGLLSTSIATHEVALKPVGAMFVPKA